MQILPDAVGQSDGQIVFWDENPEIGAALPRPVQMISEVQWGAGLLDGEDCLILYLFLGEQALELYLPQTLPTAPAESLDVWALLWAWAPRMLKVRYGRSPADREREVVLLLPEADGERLSDALRAFAERADAGRESGEAALPNGEFLRRLRAGAAGAP